MSARIPRWTYRAVLSGWMLVGLVALAACGQDNPSGTDPCAETTCQFGVCNSDAGGACTNPETCRESSECLPGYECGPDGSCVAASSCSSDGDCESGVCESGACVNPETCGSDEECLPRTYCAADGTCQPDPCNNTECERGTCERGTGECVEAESCTEETEYRDCLSDQQCIDGTCQTEEEFCDSLTCDPGVCSFEEQGCVEPDECESDEDCFEGNRCNDMNRCVENPCEQGDVECEGDGVCDPASGMCENAETCTSTSDCTNSPKHICVQGTCRLEASACGDAEGEGGCPGNQVCQYSEEGLRASCIEPEDCDTSIDCQESRQCNGRNCVAPSSCRADRFEDNDTAENATDFPSVSMDNALTASLCPDDTDVYTFSTTDLVDESATGTLLVEFHLPRADVGLGALEASLNGPDGGEVASGSLEANVDEDHLRLEAELTESSHGEYTIEVAAGASMNTAGLDYDLSVNVATQGVVEACGDAEPLEVGELVSGNTNDGGSSGLELSCAPDADEMNEKIYALQLDSPQELHFEAEPKFSDGDVSLALRSRCTEPATESACVESAGTHEAETLTTVLGAGTHYVVVETRDADASGAFTLQAEHLNDKRCTSRDDYCSGSVTSNKCINDGGRFEQLSCDLGCNPSTGRCYPPTGNYCEEVTTITENASRGFDLREFTDSFDPAPGSCLGDDPRSGGPDRVYEVEIPADQAVQVTANYEREVQGSLYLAESCEELSGSCESGAQDSREEEPYVERLTYSNMSEDTETRYVVVDSEANENLAPVTVNFEYLDITCEPGVHQCGDQTGNQQVCNEYGTAFEMSDECGEWPCQTGDGSSACRRADGCSDVPNITDQVTPDGGNQYTLLWGDYDSSFESDDTCGGSAGIDSSETAGNDAVFEIDVAAGEVLTASAEGNGNYSLYVKESTESPATCGSLADECVAADNRDGGTSAEIGQYFDEDKTVYLVLDTENGQAPDGAYLNVDVAPSICTPENVVCGSNGNVQYCEQPGLSQKAFACDSNGCSSGVCNSKNAEHCYDPDNITTDVESGTFSTSELWTDFDNDYVGSGCGNIGTSESGGPESVYRVDLEATQTDAKRLSASLSGDSEDHALYVTDEASCGADLSGAACLASATASDGATADVTYTSGTSPETVYLVAEGSDTSGEEYTLEASTESVCALGTVTCSSGGDMEYCPLGSTSRETASCEGCCSDGLGGGSDVSRSVPAGGTITESVDLGACPSGSVSQVLVGVRMPETFHIEIELQITSPSGTNLTLMEGSGSRGSGFGYGIDGVFPLGEYHSADSLDQLQGEPAAGTWTLTVNEVGGFTSYPFEGWHVSVACD